MTEEGEGKEEGRKGGQMERGVQEGVEGRIE